MATKNVTPATFVAVHIGATAGDIVLFATGNGYTGFVPKNGVQYVAATKGLAVIGGVIDGANANNVTLRGLKSLNVACGKQAAAALRCGAAWTVEDVEVVAAAFCGIYAGGAGTTFIRTYARDCGQQGWWVNANNIMLKDCGATGNNTKKENPAWEAGGVKFYITKNCVVDGGEWSRNGGPAIWFDYQNENFIVKNTEVYGNHGWTQAWAGCGIVSEINGFNAPAGIIENNYVHDNSGDGIAIWESLRNVVRNNTLARDTIGWRDMTNRAPYRTRDNQVTGNKFYQGQVNNPPANANNVVSGTIQLTAEPVAPAPDPTQSPAQPGLPVGAVEIGMDNVGNVWHLAAGALWKDAVKQAVTEKPGVDQAIIGAAGFIIQKTKDGSVWTEVGDEQPARWTATTWPTTPPTTPPADNPEIAKLKAQIAALDIEVQEANDAIDKLNVELTAADATITTLRGRLKTIEATAGLP